LAGPGAARPDQAFGCSDENDRIVGTLAQPQGDIWAYRAKPTDTVVGVSVTLDRSSRSHQQLASGLDRCFEEPMVRAPFVEHTPVVRRPPAYLAPQLRARSPAARAAFYRLLLFEGRRWVHLVSAIDSEFAQSAGLQKPEIVRRFDFRPFGVRNQCPDVRDACMSIRLKSLLQWSRSTFSLRNRERRHFNAGQLILPLHVRGRALCRTYRGRDTGQRCPGVRYALNVSGEPIAGRAAKAGWFGD
jgi:hypothetical protein